MCRNEGDGGSLKKSFHGTLLEFHRTPTYVPRVSRATRDRNSATRMLNVHRPWNLRPSSTSTRPWVCNTCPGRAGVFPRTLRTRPSGALSRRARRSGIDSKNRTLRNNMFNVRMSIVQGEVYRWSSSGHNLLNISASKSTKILLFQNTSSLLLTKQIPSDTTPLSNDQWRKSPLCLGKTLHL